MRSSNDHMPLEWTYSSENVDWEELYRLYLAAALGKESPADLKLGFAKSEYKCFACDQERLVAVGRALALRKDCSYICGVAVHPNYQGLGIGTEIMTRLIALSKPYTKITLHASPGKEDFYRKLGFVPTGMTMTRIRDQSQAVYNAGFGDTP